VILIQASIVPDIPERMNKRMPGEFEKLRNERNRMDRKIQRYHQMIHKPIHSSPKDSIQHHHYRDTQHHSKTHKRKSKILGHAQQSKIQAHSIQPQEVHAQKLPERKEQSSQNSQNNQNNKQSSRYYVIGGSFQKKSNAKILKHKLSNQGYQPIILSKPDQELYRVAYGGFNKSSAANRFLKHLSSSGKNAWLYKKTQQ